MLLDINHDDLAANFNSHYFHFSGVSMSTSQDVLKKIAEDEVKFVDFRFTLSLIHI